MPTCQLELCPGVLTQLYTYTCNYKLIMLSFVSDNFIRYHLFCILPVTPTPKHLTPPAGHETTGSALTWTLYLLVNNPEKMAKAQVRHRDEQP